MDYIFNKSVDDVFSEFRRGFFKVLDEQVVGIFEPEQLINVAIGNANYNWDSYEEVSGWRDVFYAKDFYEQIMIGGMELRH